MKTYKALAAGLTAGALTLVSCTPTQQKYGGGGAIAGGVGAAILGGDSTDIARAAAIGGAAGTGYAVYKERQNTNNGAYNSGGDIPPAPATSNYPTAHQSGTPGIVISPHKPYNKVRVTGMNPGQLATDPTTNKIFVVPN
ncbi:hypothetical protein N9A70_02210 [Akkermansiaceae bacterium]|jgi:hypothetical protein|nr:hypothetical protein [Akkermansiaceae bacterium]MDA7907821.1 hypothetical protein [Akkermansiaceae bacterium]MDA7933761.1 hypothetical protein [Akkermansiaceae bacterium]MDB4465045.1 hypothetical protein [Akkermansiaceae bacterium]